MMWCDVICCNVMWRAHSRCWQIPHAIPCHAIPPHPIWLEENYVTSFCVVNASIIILTTPIKQCRYIRTTCSLTYSPTHPYIHPSIHSLIHSLSHSLTHSLSHSLSLTHSPTKFISLDQEDGQEVLIKFGAVTPVLVRLDSKSGLRSTLAVPAPVPVPSQTPGMHYALCITLTPLHCTALQCITAVTSTTAVTSLWLSVRIPCRYIQHDIIAKR